MFFVLIKIPFRLLALNYRDLPQFVIQSIIERKVAKLQTHLGRVEIKSEVKFSDCFNFYIHLILIFKMPVPNRFIGIFLLIEPFQNLLLSYLISRIQNFFLNLEDRPFNLLQTDG